MRPDEVNMVTDIAMHAAKQAHETMVRACNVLSDDAMKSAAYVIASAVIAGKVEAHSSLDPLLKDMADAARNTSRTAYSETFAKSRAKAGL